MNSDLEWLKSRSDFTARFTTAELSEMLDIAKDNTKLLRYCNYILVPFVLGILAAVMLSVIPLKIPQDYNALTIGGFCGIFAPMIWTKINTYIIREKLLKTINMY